MQRQCNAQDRRPDIPWSNSQETNQIHRIYLLLQTDGICGRSSYSFFIINNDYYSQKTLNDI